MITLYKIGSGSGQILSWTIWRDRNFVYTEWTPPNSSSPQVSEAYYDTPELASRGYNEAITKKRRNGYSETIEVPPMLPMLANKYSPKSAKFPYFLQPKYDGQRCIYDSSTKTLFSRTGQRIVSLPSLLQILVSSDFPSVDGELYCHGRSLQDILSTTRQTVNITDDDTINYVIYDIPNSSMSQKERIKYLLSLAQNPLTPSPRISYAPVHLVYSHGEVVYLHEKYVDHGYEGVMLRYPNGTYRFGTRSSFLLKYKTEFDDTFVINKITKDRTGNPIFSLRSPNGLFNAVIEGTDAYRKSLYERRHELIGKPAHVKYFCLTNEGIPRNARIVSLT